ncbi:polyprenyl synthetase family protein [Psychrobacter sp. FDAARGOS_221]|uniref:polyprenyl synthetase family protein n=1 Tax=Psychrobacter sp. FDAARGOS_221 TaxID=1975705 RepID=UPI000BB56905|nr:farnesyl diphosphate synthase [Psychrobacter sp. FDAARGOS_221]PNK61057.1 polyprenyl synthetase family protein [Psychrobacter sp. FDAARGOS_221]
MTNQHVNSQINRDSTFDHFSQQVITTLQADIEQLLTHAALPSPLNEACFYAMTGAGKKVRPLLVASAYHSVLSSSTDSDDSATTIRLNDSCRRAMLAVELLHTYSLIHDDLPCMDDDDLRRGRPTCHIEFGEATALLAGDVLQTLAFEALSADLAGFEPISDTHAAKLIRAFAPRARRMVSGQMLDLNAEDKQVTQDELEAIHRDKTGALIEASALMGGVCADATQEQLQALRLFASSLGLAFQVQDDILDVTSDTDVLGKPTGSDEGLNKSTYVKLMGVESATDYAKSLFDDATTSIDQQFGNHTALNTLADWLWDRKK